MKTEKNEQQETFVCQGCKHELELKFSIKTQGWCYLCDPNISLEELLEA